jgi:cytochrome c-type biogenesis protein CcmH/NrfG
MSDQELQDQFALCQQWQDAEQWDLLAMAYYVRGYLLNSVYCFNKADAVRVAVETEVA